MKGHVLQMLRIWCLSTHLQSCIVLEVLVLVILESMLASV